MNHDDGFSKITCIAITFSESISEDDKDRYYDGRATFSFYGPGHVIMRMYGEIYDGCSCTLNIEEEYTKDELLQYQKIHMHTQREEAEILKRQVKNFGVKLP